MLEDGAAADALAGTIVLAGAAPVAAPCFARQCPLRRDVAVSSRLLTAIAEACPERAERVESLWVEREALDGPSRERERARQGGRLL